LNAPFLHIKVYISIGYIEIGPILFRNFGLRVGKLGRQ
jgi:hypothetical protein